jgi:hypothetical protein
MAGRNKPETNRRNIKNITKAVWTLLYGPFRIAAKISHITYHLTLPETWKIYNIFHASLLTL